MNSYREDSHKQRSIKLLSDNRRCALFGEIPFIQSIFAQHSRLPFVSKLGIYVVWIIMHLGK